MGASGVVGVRFETTSTMNRLIAGLHVTVLAYGTAVKVRPRHGAASQGGSGTIHL